MRIKVYIQEERPDPTDEQPTYLETINELSSANPKVVAQFLRAVADHYDPPKAVTRNG